MPAGAVGELRHEVGVHEEALGEVAELGRFDRAEDLGEPGGHAVDVARLQDREIGFVDLVWPGAADRVGDHLHVALEELGRAVDENVVAVFEGAVILLAGIPETGGDGAAAIGELELKIEVAVAVGAELLIGGQEDLVHVFVVAELADVASEGSGGHWESRGWRPRGRRWQRIQPRSRLRHSDRQL